MCSKLICEPPPPFDGLDGCEIGDNLCEFGDNFGAIAFAEPQRLTVTHGVGILVNSCFHSARLHVNVHSRQKCYQHQVSEKASVHTNVSVKGYSLVSGKASAHTGFSVM